MTVKILFVIDSLFLEGTEKHLFEITENLPSQKYEIHLFSFTNGPLAENFRAVGVEVGIFSSSTHGPFGIKKLFSLLSFMRGRKLDIVHTFLTSSDLWGRIAAVIKGVPVIISSKRGYTEKKFLHRLFSRMLNMFTGKIIFVSNDLEKIYRAKERMPVEKCLVIPNGVNTKKILEFKESYSRKTERIKAVVSIIARLHPIKDHPTFMRAAADLTQDHVMAEFWIVGDGGERDSLKNLAEKLGVEKDVKFLGVRKDIYKVISESDIIVLTSLYEGMPNAVLEAMAFGKPVVATSVGGIKEIISDGVDGFLVPPGNSCLLAQKIRRLIEEPKLAQALGLAAKEKVFSKFAIDKTIRAYDSVYKSFFITSSDERKLTMGSLVKKIIYLSILWMPFFRKGSETIPVLTYHSVDGENSQLSVQIDVFEDQMYYLKKEGYETLDSNELSEYLLKKRGIPKKKFVLTFDEAYRNFTNVVPVLKKYGFRAMLFVVAGMAGEKAKWTLLSQENTLNWEEIRKLPADVVEVGSHSLTHHSLAGKNTEVLKEEIEGSRKLIEAEIGRKVDIFAYPLGEYDQLSKEAVRNNYKIAFSTNFGIVTKKSDPAALERVDANMLRDPLAFKSFFHNKIYFEFLGKFWKNFRGYANNN